MGRGSHHLGSVLALELVPAALFNFAIAFAVANVLQRVGPPTLAAPASVAAGIVAFLIAWFALRRFGHSEIRFAMPSFQDHTVEVRQAEEPDELLLTDRVAAPVEQHPHEDELLLDDILANLGPDSRVVRLFDPKAMPTAGELHARIDRHLRSGTPQAVPDATQELRDALAELRQSLR